MKKNEENSSVRMKRDSQANDIEDRPTDITEPAHAIYWCVYALRCRDGSIYIGSTNNLKRRLIQHDNGTGSKFVRTRRPFEVVRVISCPSPREAHQLEYRLKKLERRKKLEELSLDPHGRPHADSTGQPASQNGYPDTVYGKSHSTS